MEPAIQTGGVIFVYERPPDQIEEGDVITFNLEGPGTEVTTHRVVDVVERDGTRMFVTKGDANEDPDPAPVPPDAVIGVVPTPFGVLATIPVMGRLLLFARSDLGIALLVFVPAGLLVVSEVWSLYRAASGGGDGSEAEDGPTDADPDPAVEADAVSAPDPATSADGGTTAGGTDGEETEP
jgi:signal peptidase